MECRPYHTLNVKLYFNQFVQGPDHTSLGTMPREEIPPFEPKVWESIKVGLLGTVQFINDLYAWIGYEWRNMEGGQSYMDRWAPDEYHVQTGTFRLGLNYGFYLFTKPAIFILR